MILPLWTAYGKSLLTTQAVLVSDKIIHLVVLMVSSTSHYLSHSR